MSRVRMCIDVPAMRRVRARAGLAFLALAIALMVSWSLPGRSSAAPLPRIGLKVLLVGTSATEPDFVAWQTALQREGVPFDTVVGASHTPITAATLTSPTLADGTQVGNYQAVIMSIAGDTDCGTGTCVSDLSAAESAALESYEQQFEVRQITGDAYPGATYGMNTPTTSGALDGVQGTLTADGQKVFASLKGSVPMDTGTFGYEATPLTATSTPALPAGASFDTLVSGPNSSSLVGVYTHPDGVQEMVETFNQNANQLQSELLRHGAIAWATRGVYFGDQRNYLDTDIDDNFLADDSWDTTAHTTDYTPADALREGPSDVDYAATWSAANSFRIDELFNGGGSAQYAADNGSDPLLAEFKKTDPATGKPYTSDFGWINHTWDHPNLDQGCATQNYIEAEIQQNTAWGSSAAGLNLTSSTDPSVALGAENPSVVVTGEHSGLANLLPGNPGIIDPPSFNSATVSTTSGTLPAGTYDYAITDQFSPTGGESNASQTQITLTAPGSVALSYDAVCHAADYKIYREVTGSNAWTLVSTIPAVTNTTAFANPASTTDTTGGGPLPQSYTDTGAAGTPSATAPPDDQQRGRERLRAEPEPGRGVQGDRDQDVRLGFLQAVPEPRQRHVRQRERPGRAVPQRRDVHRADLGRSGRGPLSDQHLLQRLHRGPRGRRVQPPVPALVTRRRLHEQRDDDLPDGAGDVCRHHQQRHAGDAAAHSRQRPAA